jgi:hypothetical protein
VQPKIRNLPSQAHNPRQITIDRSYILYVAIINPGAAASPTDDLTLNHDGVGASLYVSLNYVSLNYVSLNYVSSDSLRRTYASPPKQTPR